MSIGNHPSQHLIHADGVASPGHIEYSRSTQTVPPGTYLRALEELAVLTEGVYDEIEDVDAFVRRVREGEFP